MMVYYFDAAPSEIAGKAPVCGDMPEIVCVCRSDDADMWRPIVGRISLDNDEVPYGDKVLFFCWKE